MDPVALSEVMMSVNAGSNDRVVRLLCYNVFCRPPGIKNNSDDYKDERLNDIMTEEVVGQYDVIAFQELFGFGSRRQQEVIRKARELGLQYSTFSPKPSFFTGRIIDGGLMILSRYPFEKVDSITFSTGVGVDGWCAKGALYACVRISKDGEDDKMLLHVFTTHTQASYNTHLEHSQPEINRVNDLARNKQFEELGAFIGGKLKGDKSRSPAVLLGDLNIDSRHYHPIFSTHIALPGDNKGQHSNSYLDMLECMKSSCSKALKSPNNDNDDTTTGEVHWKDLLFEGIGEHPITVGDLKLVDNGEHQPLETQLTSKNDLGLCKSLDYIFLIESDAPHLNTRVPGHGSAEISKTHIVEIMKESVGTKPWFVENKKYTQLSDHYAVSAALRHSLK